MGEGVTKSICHQRELYQDLKMIAFLFFTLVLAVADAEFEVRGPCPKVPQLGEFDAQKFSGDWYIISFQSSGMEPAQLQCRKLHFRVGADNVITMTQTALVRGRMRSDVMTASWNPQDGALMMMKEMESRPVYDKIPYSILATDYTGYAASWTCMETPFHVHLEFKWIMSRRPTLDQRTKAMLTDMMKDAGLSVDGRMDRMVDTQCPSWQ